MQVKHGTNRGWLAGCREQCCSRARRRYTDKTLGRVTRRVPIERVQEVLRDLVENHHHTHSTISKLTGLETSTLGRWSSGTHGYVRVNSYQKLLKARNTKPDYEFYRDATGACRRLRGMALLGLGVHRVSKMTGVSTAPLAQIRMGNSKRVSTRVHEAICRAMKEALYAGPPEGPKADLARQQAAEKGYLPYGVWEDIDDPNCVPELSEPEYADPVLQDAVERTRSLMRRGFTISGIADTAGIPRPNLHKIVHGKKRTVTPETAKKIHYGCDQLEPLEDPTGPIADKSKTLATKNGW